MLGAVHARNPSMQERLELACVQMTPDPRLSMITTSQLAATCGTGPTDTHVMLHSDVHPPFNRVQLDSRDKPRFGQVKNPRIKIRVLHGCPPRRTLASQLPTEKPEGPK